MSKSLIIAEKPSVAADIAKALGGFARHDDYFEGDRAVISSAVGHLLEIGMPAEEEVKRGKWTFAHLPALPSRFALKPIEKNENRLKTLLKLIKRKDVTALINACDAGREGELIFRYIVQYAKTPKPIQRLWLQSMTPAAIRDGFEKLRTDAQMQPLADAAVCRSESDWLVGINGTRAMTAFNSKSGGFQLTTVGRVQTPTLAILVEREAKIRAFVPRNYWEVQGTFRAAGGEYTGRWFDEKFRKSDEDPDARAERLFDEARARGIADKCIGKPAVVTEESRPSTQVPPLLYDLTSLQREANGRFGFSAKTTLSLAQALYEKHKVLTYPRTDSRHLPEDYLGTVRQTLDSLSQTGYGPFAQKIINEGWASLMHSRIMRELDLPDHEHMEFAELHSGVVSPHRNQLNPYYLGYTILEDIERRWNEPTQEEQEKFGRKPGEGWAKLLEVRETENDISLLRNYLTEELCEKLDLFVYELVEEEEWTITEKRWQKVRDQLVANMTNFGYPYIEVTDGDYRGNRELLLHHRFEGAELDTRYARKVLEYVHKLWGRPVHLDTMVEDEPRVMHFDGEDHSES